MVLPIKTTLDDFDALTGYLKTQVGWVPLAKIRKTIESKYADNRKLEAARVVGLLDRDGDNVRLTPAGREYATTDDGDVRRRILGAGLRSVELYNSTIEWFHYSKKSDPTKTDVGNYWHDKHEALLEGAKGAALTDAVVFFLRMCAGAGLGKYVGAGGGRPETYLKSDTDAIERFVTDAPPPPKPTETETQPPVVPAVSQVEPALPPPKVDVATSAAVHVNVEIHIAADAKPETVAEIFKNMRKYILNDPEDG